jgi:hypothetical protein
VISSGVEMRENITSACILRMLKCIAKAAFTGFTSLEP